jgi:hypothetical protein
MVAVVGVGADRASVRTRKLLELLRPQRVIVAGVCGAVATDLVVGDLLVPDQVVDVASGTVMVPQGGRSPVAGAHGGALATVRRFGDATPAGAVAVDLETAAIAAGCDELGVAWTALRAISDVPGAVSPAVASLVGPGGGVKVGALLALLVTHPGEMSTLLRLGRQFRQALRTLTVAVESEIGH